VIEAEDRAAGTHRLSWSDLGHLGLLWLGGFDLRVTLLAVPPVLPAIHRDLGLDETSVSVLTGLPTLLLAVAAVPGSLMIARLGARRALLAGLLAIGLGSALRGVGTSVEVLFAMTLVMGAGVAVSQPVFPTLVREWMPARVALATAVYSNGLLFGELVPASVTGPWLLPLLHGSWPLTFLAWSLPVFSAALLMVSLTSHLPLDPTASRRWWPEFRRPQLWQVGVVVGLGSAAYFGANTFLPDFVHATGRAGLKDPALTALNSSQLLASFLCLAAPDRLVGRRWPFVMAGAMVTTAGAGIALTPGAWVVVWAGVIGFATALALVLTLALPPLLAAPEDVPRFSAGVFLISYSTAFLGPVAGGAAWDSSHAPAAPFVVLASGGAMMALLAAVTSYRRAPARAG